MPSKHIRSTQPNVGAGGGGTTVLPAFSDTIGLKIGTTDTLNAPTDAAGFLLKLAEADTLNAPTDALNLNIKGLGDTVNAPTDGRTFTARVWLSATTQVSTNGVTNPASANGQNDGAVATYTSAVTGDANPRTTSVLGANVPTFTITSAVLRVWFKSVNTLVTSTGAIAIDATGHANTIVFANSALNTTVDHLTGDFTFDLIAAGINTLAAIQSIVFRAATSDAVAGVTPHVLTLDAASIEIAGAF